MLFHYIHDIRSWRRLPRARSSILLSAIPERPRIEHVDDEALLHVRELPMICRVSASLHLQLLPLQSRSRAALEFPQLLR